jgi:hypothetical protein
MSDAFLPKPDKPYPDWSRFLKDVWMHGMSVSNINQDIAKTHVKRAAQSIAEVFTRRNEASKVRPSAFLACARQTYYSVQGEDSGKMPDNIGSTFAVGHLLHELSYAAVQSALPPGFKASTEVRVSLPEWWPEDVTRFNQGGHVDMTIKAESFGGYLAEGQPAEMLIDFKTMGSFSYRKHGKTVWGEDPDAFGYLAQLAVYADSLGMLETGAIIAGINRDSLTKPLAPRFITPDALRAELDRVKIAVDMAVEGCDPGEEFLVRHGKDAYFQCGRGGRPGYCAFRKVCGDNPTREGD